MSIKKQIFIAIGILSLTAGIYGYQEYTRGNKYLAFVEADYILPAIDIIKEFESNENAANAKFLDKIVAVNGEIKGIIRVDEMYYTVIIGGQDNQSSVRCSIDPDQHIDENRLQTGTFITIKGACTGFNEDALLGSDVILNRCVIEKIEK